MFRSQVVLFKSSSFALTAIKRNSINYFGESVWCERLTKSTKFTACGHCFRYLYKLGGRADILSIKSARSYHFNVDGELGREDFGKLPQ